MLSFKCSIPILLQRHRCSNVEMAMLEEKIGEMYVCEWMA